jgi:hypothetical protein
VERGPIKCGKLTALTFRASMQDIKISSQPTNYDRDEDKRILKVTVGVDW